MREVSHHSYKVKYVGSSPTPGTNYKKDIMPKGVFSLRECPICLREIKSNAFNRHYNVCLNPRIIIKKKRIAWNKGLDKSDPRIALTAKKNSEIMKGRIGHPVSEENKLKLSKLQSERLKSGYADGTRRQAGGFCKWFEVDGIPVQGSWELRAAKILKTWKQIGTINNWNRCKERICYYADGQLRIYLPDFMIERCDGSKYILEIKGRKTYIDDLKWAAAREKFELEVWGLEEIISFE